MHQWHDGPSLSLADGIETFCTAFYFRSNDRKWHPANKFRVSSILKWISFLLWYLGPPLLICTTMHKSQHGFSQRNHGRIPMARFFKRNTRSCSDVANWFFRFFRLSHGHPVITRMYLNTSGMGSKMCLMSTRSYVFGRGLDRWNAWYSFNDRQTIDRRARSGRKMRNETHYTI